MCSLEKPSCYTCFKLFVALFVWLLPTFRPKPIWTIVSYTVLIDTWVFVYLKYMYTCSISRISPSWARAGCKKTLCLLHYPRKIKFIHSFIRSFIQSLSPSLSLDVWTRPPAHRKDPQNGGYTFRWRQQYKVDWNYWLCESIKGNKFSPSYVWHNYVLRHWVTYTGVCLMSISTKDHHFPRS